VELREEEMKRNNRKKNTNSNPIFFKFRISNYIFNVDLGKFYEIMKTEMYTDRACGFCDNH